MTYVEWLRVRNCIKVLAIVLAVLVGLAIVLRVSVSRYMSPEEWVKHISLNPGATQQHITLPDGTPRTIIDDPGERTHVIIDDHGSAGTHIVITEPTKHAHKEHDHFNIGSIQVVESPHGDVTMTTIDTNGSVPVLYYMGIADFFALLIATILAAPLAREINGHLETALTKPISRIGYALNAIGVDVVGILAASLISFVAFYICQLLFEKPSLDFSGVNTLAILMGIVCPLAWYAMLLAATTWFPRAYGALLGLIPLGLLGVGLLTLVPTNNVVALFIHDVAWWISRFDPLSYVSLAKPDFSEGVSYAGASSFTLRFLLEVLFFVAYSAIAIVRWQRVEA